MTAPGVFLPVLNAQGPARLVMVEIAADLPALGLTKGQPLALCPIAAPDCDCLYVLADGNLARLQFFGGGTFRMVDAEGAVSVVPSAAVQVAARVISLPDAAA